jgi:hypothetical protein
MIDRADAYREKDLEAIASMNSVPEPSTMEAARYPFMQSMGQTLYGLGGGDGVLGRPLEATSNLLNSYAYGEGGSLKDKIVSGLELIMPVPKPIKKLFRRFK